LVGYERKMDALRDLGVGVVAGSVDGREDAADLVDRLSLSFPVLWGLDPRQIRDRYGAYVHDDGDDVYLQPLNVVLRGEEIRLVSYSSSPLARLQADELVDWVDYVKEHAA
jgi:hypothetical protein